jgi:thiamine phosphate synthase YjbQ (UPF0047 family)
MIIDPNYPNQIKIQDTYGDQVWFDKIENGTVVVTATSASGNEVEIELTEDDLTALLAHLAPPKPEHAHRDTTYHSESFWAHCVCGQFFAGQDPSEAESLLLEHISAN